MIKVYILKQFRYKNVLIKRMIYNQIKILNNYKKFFMKINMKLIKIYIKLMTIYNPIMNKKNQNLINLNIFHNN